MAAASGARRKQLEGDTTAIIQSHIRELQSLDLLVSSYAEYGKHEGFGSGVLNFTETASLGMEEIAGKLGIGKAPSEIMAQSDKLRAAIRDMQDILANPGGTGKGGGSGSDSPLSKKLKDLKDRQEEYSRALGITTEQTARLRAANDNSSASYERLQLAFEVENELREQGFRIGTAQYDLNHKLLMQQKLDIAAIEHTNEAREKANRALEEADETAKRRLDEIAEAMNQPFESAAKGIQDAFTNAFEGLFDGSIDSASDAADAIKRVFIRMAAEIATLQVFGPQIAGLSAGGLTGSAPGSGGTDVLSLVKNGLSKSLISDSVTASLNQYGSKIGLDTLGASVGKIATTGNLFAGYAGSFLGSKVFGSSTAGSAGSTIGGAAGAYFGGPIGAGIGSFIGSGIGSAFSGPRAHPASTFSTQGVFGSPLDLRSKHMDTELASGLAGSLKSALSTLMGSGLDLSFIKSLQGGVDDGKGFLSTGDFSKWGADTVGFDPDNPDAGLAKFLKLVVGSAGDLSGIMDAELIPALKNLSTEGKSSAQVLEEIVAALTRDDMRRAFVADINAQLLDQMLPGYSALREETAKYQANLAQAKKLGVDAGEIARINELHELKRKALLEQNNQAQQEGIAKATELVQRYGRVSEGFGSLLAELRNGKYTTLSPTANLADLRQQVLATGSRARLGDADAQEALLDLLPKFLDLSADVNGYNADYAKDQGVAADLAQSAKSVADRQLEIQQKLLEQAGVQTGLLAQLAGGGTGNANDKLVRARAGGYTGLGDDQIKDIFASAGVSVAPGGGRVTAFLNDAANAAINANLNRVFRSLGVPGFANGGYLASGRPGLDTNLARLTVGEGVLNTRAMQAIGVPTLNYVNATGRMPGNDNGSSAEIAALRDEVRRLTAVVAASGSQTVEILAGIRTSNAALAEEARKIA